MLASPLYAGVPEILARLQQVRAQTALCDLSVDKIRLVEASLRKVGKKGKDGMRVADSALADFAKSQQACTPEARELEKALLNELQGLSPLLPVSPMPFIDSTGLMSFDSLALAYIQSHDSAACPELELGQLYTAAAWHETLLNSGWPCTARNFIRLSGELNDSHGYPQAQESFDSLSQATLPELKRLFHETFKNGINGHPFKIAFVPQLSWENGALNTAFPYSLFTSKTELTNYRFLVREFKKLGVGAAFISRNSMNSLGQQVEETRKGILKLDGPHVIISRSMGARMLRELIVSNDPAVNEKAAAWFNVGGTPHGSVISTSKARPDVFYQDVVSTILGALRLPVSLVALDPRIPDHLKQTLFSALIRQNLLGLSPVSPTALSYDAAPVVNAIFVRPDYVRATQGVDPSWKDMLEQGPTEGSSPLYSSAIDTPRSARIIVDSDHLAFWKYTPQQALAVYLRLLISSARMGLVR